MAVANTGGPVVADRRLYLTRDGTRLVPDGDVDAWRLFCTPGMRIPREQAARYGLLDEPTADPEPESSEEAPQSEGESEAEPKQRTPRTNKARRPAANKGGAGAT